MNQIGLALSFVRIEANEKARKSLGRQQNPLSTLHSPHHANYLTKYKLQSHLPYISLPQFLTRLAVSSFPSKVLLTILIQSSILSPFLSPSFLSIVQDKVVSKTERQNGTIVSIDPPFHSRHLLTMHPAPSLASLAWESTETSRKLQNHIGPASHHRKSSLRKANVSVESTGSYRKKPASTSFPAMTSLTTTMSWTTSSFSE